MTVEGETWLPFEGLRGVIARRLRASATLKPPVTIQAWARADHLRRILSETKQVGAAPSVTDAMIYVTARVLRRYPGLNGHVEEGGVRLLPVVNVGFACSVPDGLLVPVIRDADRKELDEISQERREKTARARAGRLKPPDLAGGTFTVTNLGAGRVQFFTPIINPPEIAILGIGALTQTVAWEEDRPSPVWSVPLSLTFDHAAVDGAEAGVFLSALIDAIEGGAFS